MNGKTVRIARPTKIELIRLKRRLALARKIHRILRERLIILVSEFMDVARLAVDTRMAAEEALQGLYNRVMALNAVRTGEDRPYMPSKALSVRGGYRSVAGVRTVVFDFEPPSGWGEVPPLSPLPLVEIEEDAGEFWKRVLRLAEVESSLISLGEEIRRVRRLVNVLEHMLIPRLENTIKILTMKFEEREREEKTRLKHVKAMLEKKRR